MGRIHKEDRQEVVTLNPTHSSVPPTSPHSQAHVHAQADTQRDLQEEFPFTPDPRGDAHHLCAGYIICSNPPVLAASL